MVVVSDDVHEYAVALKDTEDKMARCPSRVSPHVPLLTCPGRHTCVSCVLGTVVQTLSVLSTSVLWSGSSPLVPFSQVLRATE